MASGRWRFPFEAAVKDFVALSDPHAWLMLLGEILFLVIPGIVLSDHLSTIDGQALVLAWYHTVMSH